jgi:hypothetical protein
MIVFDTHAWVCLMDQQTSVLRHATRHRIGDVGGYLHSQKSGTVKCVKPEDRK